MNSAPLPHAPGGRFITRRAFLASSLAAVAAARGIAQRVPAAAEPLIDVHQHIVYGERTADDLVQHQRNMGATLSVLMPTGDRGADHPGGSGDFEPIVELYRRFPNEFVYFANERSDLPEAAKVIEQQLRRGAIGIGEQKFRVDCDSPHMERIAEVAREFNVPILMHFQHATYNRHIERFHRMLEKFPTVNFIGHAQAWWGNIDKNHDQSNNYPRGPVTPGGITDRYLSDYPNCYGEVSAGSGNNAIMRDEDHYRDFMVRHQDKLLYGSDCSEATGRIPACVGARTIAAIRRLAPNEAIQRKIFSENAKKLLKI